MPEPIIEPVIGPTGDLAHPLLVARSAQYERRIHEVTPSVFCAVGYGMANTTLVLGPKGAVIIDSGECREELTEVLEAFGDRLDRPIVGVVYTHSHYLWGTAAIEDYPTRDIEIWGHEDIERTIAHVGGEIGPAYTRRMRLQFGYHLPADGPDSMSNVGLSSFFFRPGPKTVGFVAPTHTIPRVGRTTTSMAGLEWVFESHASDSEDTIVISLPELEIVINNHVWPVLFNIYPLRGERYRDPMVLLDGLQMIRECDPEHLVGAHGVPIDGRAQCQQAVADYADSIQYLWDQTVRGINAGADPDELAATIEFPPRLATSPWLQPLYGEVPFHVRQIHNGLFGWFGTDTSTLHPVSPDRRAALTVEAMGGRDAVLDLIQKAIDGNEQTWAAEICSHLLRVNPDDPQAKTAKAACLRYLAQRTTAANTRAHYLSEALFLEGHCDPLGETPQIPAVGISMRAGGVRSLHALRVQLDPVASADTDLMFAIHFTDTEEHAWLHVVGGVARFGIGTAPQSVLALEITVLEWARLRARRVAIVGANMVLTSGNLTGLADFFALFDHGPR